MCCQELHLNLLIDSTVFVCPSRIIYQFSQTKLYGYKVKKLNLATNQIPPRVFSHGLIKCICPSINLQHSVSACSVSFISQNIYQLKSQIQSLPICPSSSLFISQFISHSSIFMPHFSSILYPSFSAICATQSVSLALPTLMHRIV